MSKPFEEPTTAEFDPYDAAEQRAAVAGEQEVTATPAGVPLEASEADTVEQTVEVPDDEDDYPV